MFVPRAAAEPPEVPAVEAQVGPIMATGLSKLIAVWHQLGRLGRVDTVGLLPPIEVLNAALAEAYALLRDASPPERARMLGELQAAIELLDGLAMRLSHVNPPHDN